MTIKEYLSQALTIDQRIKSKQAQIVNMRDMLDSVNRPTDEIWVKSTGYRDRIGDIVAKIQEGENELADLICQLLEVKRGIRNAIERVEKPIYRLILEERYLNGKRWEDIAANNHYSWNYLIYNLHPTALKHVEMPENIKDVKKC